VRGAEAQLELDVESPRNLERKIEERREQLDRFFRLCREVCREHTYEAVATELEREWGDLGRHVSTGILKMALAPGNERNYFRWEWGAWFAEANGEIADLYCEIAGRGKPKKAPEEELRDLKELIRAELPRRAAALIRKAETP
jgi:hypothetical protein